MSDVHTRPLIPSGYSRRLRVGLWVGHLVTCEAPDTYPDPLREWAWQACIASFGDPEAPPIYSAALEYVRWLRSLPETGARS